MRRYGHHFPEPDDTFAAPERPRAVPVAAKVGASLALVFVVGAAIFNVWDYQTSDDRWRPQANAFMSVLQGAATASRGEGRYGQWSQLNGFVKDERDYLTGEFWIGRGDVTGITDPVDLTRATNVVRTAAAAAGYTTECREIPEARIADVETARSRDFSGAAHVQQCRLREDGKGRGSVLLVIDPSGAMSLDADAGHVNIRWY